MKPQYVYVVIFLPKNEVIMVYKDKKDIDDEYFGHQYSIQHVYFWK